MMLFREVHPTRSTGVPHQRDYQKYRPQLMEDFRGRCGYTDCDQRHWGGGFQIDHFAPLNPKLVDKSKLQAFQDRKCDYTNLVYACPQVNLAKRNRWPSEDPYTPIDGGIGFLDPCSDLNEHFYRTNGGGIRPKPESEVAVYMYRVLRLHLKRYEIYWRMDRLYERIDKLDALHRSLDKNNPHSNQVEETLAELHAMYLDYMRYIGASYLEVTRS